MQAGDSRVEIVMPLADWFFIDAVMDNAAQSSIETQDPDATRRPRAIREAGWAVTQPLTDQFVKARQWPPPDAVMSQGVTIALSPSDWNFIVDGLRRSSEIADRVGHHDDAARGRELADRLAR